MRAFLVNKLSEMLSSGTLIVFFVLIDPAKKELLLMVLLGHWKKNEGMAYNVLTSLGAQQRSFVLDLLQ